MKTIVSQSISIILCLLVATACGGGGGEGSSGGSGGGGGSGGLGGSGGGTGDPDAGVVATIDASLDMRSDAGLDAGEPVPDAAIPSSDASLPDASPPDASLPDAALPDAALPDAAVPDAALPDAEPPQPPPPGVSTLAGSDQAGNADGPGQDAQFNNPVNVVVSPSGDLYVADFNNSLIRRITAQGQVVTLPRPTGFFRPFGLAFAPDGTFYVQTDGNDLGQNNPDTGTIWRIDPQTGAGQVVARNLGRPRGLAALSDGRLVLVDLPSHVLWLLDPAAASPQRQFLAGAEDVAGYADGSGASARFAFPIGVAVDGNDTIYVADRENHRIRRVTLAGDVTTLAGTGIAGHVDGGPAVAELNRPQGLAVDALGNLYISEIGAAWVRKIDLTTGILSTLAGDGTFGFLDGDPAQAQFFGLEGIDVNSDATILYIADGNRGTGDPFHRIRRLTLTP